MNDSPLPVWVDADRDVDEMGCILGDLGQIGVKLPGTSSVLVCWSPFARALAAALLEAADRAERTGLSLRTGEN